jgi:hypothetical protein
VVPLVPDVPDVPLVPLVPDVPLVPEVPLVPLVPEVPLVPDVPLVPPLVPSPGSTAPGSPSLEPHAATARSTDTTQFQRTRACSNFMGR